MKRKIQHVVPLSRQAVAALKELYPYSGPEGFVFPSIRSVSRPISENTVNAALRRMGYAKNEMTGHGFRSIRKDGLIVDVRCNDGGSTSRMILDRLTRRHYGTGYIRGVGYPMTYPWGGYTHVFTGQMALLINGRQSRMAKRWRGHFAMRRSAS